MGNSADGIFLLGSSAVSISGVTPNPTPSDIAGNTISGNVIAGNNEDGIQVFGTGAAGNPLILNRIGISSAGTRIANGADGILVE